jgi:hypothetical protein
MTTKVERNPYRNKLGQYVESPAKRNQKAIEELYRAFDFFNETFAEGNLPKVIITIQEAGRKNAYGWFGESFWKDGICEQGVCEINLSAEYMGRDPYAILETLLHEMAHLKNAINDIRDCTSGQYHNKKFKIAAEQFGLIVKRAGNKGWAFTSLGEEARAAIDQFKPDEDILNSLQRRKNKRIREKRYISLIVSADLESSLTDAVSNSSMTQKEFVEEALREAINNRP